MKIKKNANAKINIGLEILNKRSDDYHNLNTVFYSLHNLYDELIFERNDEQKVNIQSNIPELNGKDNLIYTAIRKIERKVNKKIGVNINLTKNIPMGAGLGGGSSDAACTINAIDQLYELGLSYNDKLILAQAVGSDVPFFLQGGAAIGRSRGESLTFFEYEIPLQIVVVSPNIHVSTPAAYGELDRDSTPRNMVDYKMILDKSKDNPSLMRSMVFNEFEKPIFAKHPEIKEIKQKLYEQGAIFSLMSGSGSSVFGMFESGFDVEKLKSIFPNYKVIKAN
ncbi:MAG: 4-(cytidine 5'-diphospho)-2-C-methyl-D-erythritol kinase [Ignavibacteriae bacterium HGW-Ignavibacteriae-4]|jgi:4-diphosphocytidyl-2-C-methyl-D-erythritol kinase|nr:MAG: 4-(cytidine 5'-diphospho)-2-C-methyl-D-erythritol kinase [Ignavibacteriae bacterium HGW-Ignavibacteriae-4]